MQFLNRTCEGVLFSMEGIRKGYPFLSKMVYKTVRVWTLGRRHIAFFPQKKNFLEYPSPYPLNAISPWSKAWQTMLHVARSNTDPLGLFYQKGDEISCKVTGKRKHSKGPQGGMAILCKLCWTSSNKKQVKKLVALIAAERNKILQRYGLSI